MLWKTLLENGQTLSLTAMWILGLPAICLSVLFWVNPSLHGGWRSVHDGHPASYQIIFDKFSPQREFLSGGAEYITICDPSRKNEVPFASNQVFDNLLRGRIKNSKLMFLEFISAPSINDLIFKGVADEFLGRIFIPRITNISAGARGFARSSSTQV